MDRNPTPAELDRLFGKSKDSRKSRNVKLLIIALLISLVLNFWLFSGIKNRNVEKIEETQTETVENTTQELDVQAELREIKARLDKLEAR